MLSRQEKTRQDEILVRDFVKQNGVTRIPTGLSSYKFGTEPFSRKARLLFKRHERVRQMYRDLITHGFDKWEIASMMQVSTAQVRKAANEVGMIQNLKGYGQCHIV